MASKRIQLSDHFTCGRLLRFVWPSVAMMIFTSLYGVVDGLFVSNYAGKIPFAAVNFIFPFIMILSTPGFMLGTGGSALVAKTLGEGDKEKANRLFSLFCCTALVAGAVCLALGVILTPLVAKKMGAEGEMLELCILYGRIVSLGCIPQTVHFVFESFNVTAEKPKLGLWVTVSAGVTNIILDALFVGLFRWGIAGAAAATVIGQCVGGFVPLIYYLCPNNSLLRVVRPKFDGKALLKASVNGSSELMSNVSMSIVGMLYNVQLMEYLGENGVAAYGVIMYVNFIFISAFIGYAIGTAPLIGFNFGAQNKAELRSILKKSLGIIAAASVIMFITGELLTPAMAKSYVSYDAELLALTEHGFRIFCLSFLLCGFAIFGSSFFTALNNGLISAIISFLRTLVFETAAILFLPRLIGADGIWFSAVVAELMAVLITTVFMFAKRKKYGY